MAVAGPLAFSAFGKRVGDAVISDFAAGYPTKVLVLPVQAFSAPVQLEGWSCADGSRLRFWYGGCCPFSQVPVTAKQLASTGDLIASLEPVNPPSGGSIGYTGYMLFTATGKWKISVSEDGRSLGSATFLVSDQAS